jgi:hypothetical protein
MFCYWTEISSRAVQNELVNCVFETPGLENMVRNIVTAGPECAYCSVYRVMAPDV